MSKNKFLSGCTGLYSLTVFRQDILCIITNRSSTPLLSFVFKGTDWTRGLVMSLRYELPFKTTIFGKFYSNFIVVLVMKEVLWSEKLEE